jgi:hypothetical protein
MFKNNKNEPKKKMKSQHVPKNFFAVPHAVIDHPDYISMRWSSKALLMEIGRLYNGFNNGNLSLPFSVMKNKGFSESTLNDAKKELIQNKWIIPVRHSMKFYQCGLFAISWIPLDKKEGLDIVADSYLQRRLPKQ